MDNNHFKIGVMQNQKLRFTIRFKQKEKPIESASFYKKTKTNNKCKTIDQNFSIQIES